MYPPFRLSSWLSAAVLAVILSAGISSSAIAGEPAKRKLELQSTPVAWVTGVTVSADGSRIGVCDEGGIWIYDAKSGELLRKVGGGDRGVCFSPDGRLVAAAGFHMDKLIPIIDVETGRIVQRLAGHTVIETYAHAFSPDGKLFASAGREDEQILVWDLATGQIVHRFTDQGLNPTAIAFSPDSATLVSGGGDRTVRLWDLKAGKLRSTFKGHRDWVCTVAFSADGRTIASGCCDFGYHRGVDPARFEWGDPVVQSEWKLWDAATGELKRTVTDTGRLLSLALSPDGKSLACGLSKEVRVYDLTNEAPARVLATHNGLVKCVAFTPDGAALYSSGGDQLVQRVGLADGKVQWRVPSYHDQINSVAVSRDGGLLVTGMSDERFAKQALPKGHPALGPGATRLWDARTGRLVRRLGDPSEQIMAVAVSPDGKRVASGGVTAKGAGCIRVWDAATGKLAWSADDHAEEVLAVTFSPDGATLVTASEDGTTCLRDAQGGSVLKTLKGHDGGATSAVYSADGAMLFCGQGHGGVRIWDAHTGTLLHACKAGSSKSESIKVDRYFTLVIPMPDGQTIAECTAAMGNTTGDPLQFWNVKTGQKVTADSYKVKAGRPIALSPDGKIWATGGKSVQLTDVQTGNPTLRLDGILKKVQSIVFSADGRLLFAGGNYGTTNVWDVATGRHLVTLFTFSDERTGGPSDEWLAYSLDGYYEGSPKIERRLAWRVGDELLTPEKIGENLRRPELIEAALRSGDTVGAN